MRFIWNYSEEKFKKVHNLKMYHVKNMYYELQYTVLFLFSDPRCWKYGIYQNIIKKTKNLFSLYYGDIDWV